LKRLIEIFTDEGDVVIDPCAGSGSTLQAAYELGRNAYGFEVNKKFYTEAKQKMPCFNGRERQETIWQSQAVL
jgi:site-specific DNA-methyltransferase (adenine-specific)